MFDRTNPHIDELRLTGLAPPKGQVAPVERPVYNSNVQVSKQKAEVMTSYAKALLSPADGEIF